MTKTLQRLVDDLARAGNAKRSAVKKDEPQHLRPAPCAVRHPRRPNCVVSAKRSSHQENELPFLWTGNAFTDP